MDAFRYRAAAVLVCLGQGLLLFLWAFHMPPAAGSWIVLSVDERAGDRELGERLAAEGLRYCSESTQTVLLNDFSGVTAVPLDEYGRRLNAFDPRDDGYARRLRAFFVTGGRRRFFIRCGEAPRLLNEKLARALGTAARRIDWNPPMRERRASFNFFSGFPNLPDFPNLVCFGAAALVFLSLHRRSLFAAFCLLPALGFFALAGPGGIALGGILAAVFSLLREALGEYFRRVNGVRARLKRCLAFVAAAWPLELAAALAFLVLFGGGCVLGRLSPRFAIPGFAAFIPALLLPPWAEGRRAENAFFPLPLKKPPPGKLFPPALPVFTLAFLASAAVTFFADRTRSPDASPASVHSIDSIAWGEFPSPSEYEAHCAFQRNFSLRSLNFAAGGPAYGSYVVGKDGLIAGFVPLRPEAPPRGEYDTALAELARGLAAGESPRRKFTNRAALPALMLLLSAPVPIRLIAEKRRKRRLSGVII
jgi:hypothetical protein